MKHTYSRLTGLPVVLFSLACLFLAQKGQAQKVDSTVHKVEHTTATTAKKIGDSTASVAKKVGDETATTAKKVGDKTATTAKTVGDKTASTAVKGASAVTDKVYKGKEGPQGQDLYIDKNDRKYYVNGKGKKVFVKSSQIRDKKAQ